MGNCHASSTNTMTICRYEAEEESREDEYYNLNEYNLSFDGQQYYHNSPTNCPFKIDEREWERLQTQHYMYRSIWESNFSATVEHWLTNGYRVKVLDVGCGLGSWVLDMSHDYPTCHFTGVDTASEMFPELKPVNTQFIKANILDGLPFDDNTFDFVNMRLLYMAFTEEEWETKVIRELLRVTKFSGWVEIMMVDIRYSNLGNNGKIFFDAYLQELHSRCINTSITGKTEALLLQSKKLSSITLEQRLNPIGEWGGRLGKIAADSFVMLMRLLESRLANSMGVSHEEYKELIEIAAQEFNEQRTYSASFRLYAQKNCITL